MDRLEDDEADEEPGPLPTMSTGTPDARLLPLATVAAIMHMQLPPGARISNDAKHWMLEMATEHIGFIMTGAANHVPAVGGRNTITASHIHAAFRTLGALRH